MALFKKGKMSLADISILQALGIILYMAGIGIVMQNGQQIFGDIDNNYLGPVMFLLLFGVSILICGLLAFYYPFILVWEKKKAMEAIKLVLYETFWLALFLLFVMSVIILN